MQYVEDFLAHYVNNIGVTNKNKQILESIHKQCSRGIALTDRQHALVTKLMIEASIQGFDNTIPTQLPIREIDRSKYVKIVDYPENIVIESYTSDWQWIKIRFPFSKKDIAKIEKLKTLITHKEYSHSKGSHEHYFQARGKNIKLIVDTFKNFEIENTILEYYKQINEIVLNADNIYKNLETNIDATLSELQIVDRQKQFGLFNKKYSCTGILDTIVNRNNVEVLIQPTTPLDSIVEALMQLDRFPIVVCVDTGSEYEQVKEFYNAVKYVIDDAEQSVLFRIDSNDNENYMLNPFIKNNKLNNWVDNTTKVVYIKKKKLPKLLLEDNGFNPKTVYSKTSLPATQQVKTFINFNCDLQIYHDTHIGMIRTHSTSWRHIGKL